MRSVSSLKGNLGRISSPLLNKSIGGKTKTAWTTRSKHTNKMKALNNLRIKRAQKSLKKAEYFLNTTKEQRKQDRKIEKSAKRARRWKKIVDWRPLNWGCVRKWAYQNHNGAKAPVMVVQELNAE